MRTIVGLICLLACALNGFGQEKKFEAIQTDNEWNEGSIMLNDGTELKGLIRFDDRLGILGYRNGDIARSFTPRSVTAFEFVDGITGKQRLYYTIEHTDPKTNAVRPLFFEVLKDFKTFAVLAKIDPVEIKERKGGGGGFANSNFGVVLPTSTTTTILQSETVYFMNQDWRVEPFVQVTHKVVDRDLYDRDKLKKKRIDDRLMDKYFTPEENAAMEKFAEENDLDFRLKEDLIKILDFCADFREHNE